MSFKLERAGGSGRQVPYSWPWELPIQAVKEEVLGPSGAQPPTLLSRRLQGRCLAVGTPVLPVTRKQEVSTAGLSGRSHLMSQSPRL